jgi:penicillin-binding protein 2
MYRPRLVSHIDNLRTNVRRNLEPVLQQHIPLKPENVEFVKRAMAGVNKEGTGARSFGNAEYTNGGKTGTAQVIGMKQGEKYDEKKVSERHRDHSLFIVFAPVESPKIALMVIVENGGFGARAAAPIARTVLDYYLLGKLPVVVPKPGAAAEAEEESD